MSIPLLDYLPCDLTRYTQQILPACQAAHQECFQPLRELMATARHLSCWPVFYLPNPLPEKYFAGPQSCFGLNYYTDESIWPQLLMPSDFPPPLRETLLQEAEETNELDFWAFFAHRLPTLFEKNAPAEPQDFLLRCLFYTLCCHLPSEAMADCRVIGNEDVDLWEEYVARSPGIKALWDGFKKPVPLPLADELLAPQTYQEYLVSFPDSYHPPLRALFHHNFPITGFLDAQETAYLLAHLPINERPELNMIVDGCIRDREREQWPLSPALERLWKRMHYTWPEHESNMYEFSIAPDREPFRAYMKRYSELRRRTYEEFQRKTITDKQQILEIYRAMYAYWLKMYPQAFQKNIDIYYWALERMETQILNRFRYAVEHGWGMIEISV